MVGWGVEVGDRIVLGVVDVVVALSFVAVKIEVVVDAAGVAMTWVVGERL